MKRIYLGILAVGVALALAGPVWAGGEVLSDAQLDRIDAAGLKIDVDAHIEDSFKRVKAPKSEYNSSKSVSKTINKEGDWRNMKFKNGILVGGDVKNNETTNFIMSNGYNSIAAQNNFLMINGQDSPDGAHALGVNQINNAFGNVRLNQSSKTYVNKKSVDVDIRGGSPRP